jgi:hypothetical protein
MRRIFGVIAVIAVLLAGIAFLALRRPSIDRAAIVVVDAARCVDGVTVAGRPPAEFFADAVERSEVGRTLREDERAFIVEYLSAALAGCEERIAELRANDPLDEYMMDVARRGARTLAPEYRPDPAALDDDRAIALWWQELAEPWAWIDRRSVSIRASDWDGYIREMRDFHAEWDARRKAAVVRAPTKYHSAYAAAPVPENARPGARLVRVSFVLAMSGGQHAHEPLPLTIYFMRSGDGPPRIQEVMLRNNYSALARSLTL